MKYKEAVEIIEQEIASEFGLRDKKVSSKYIVETTCKYDLESGGYVKVKLLKDKIVEFKGSKDCNPIEMQAFVNKLQKILKKESVKNGKIK